MAIIKALNRTTILFPDHVGIKAANHVIHFSTGNTSQKNSSQTLEYPGNIVGCIAHDFNSILGTIVCSSELLLGTCQATSPHHEDIQRILQACMRGKELVAQIICYACNRSVQKSPVDLAQLINELIPLLQATIPSHIMINKKFDAHHCVISGNYTQIQQIIVNLITNAVYALRTVTDPVLDIQLTNNGKRSARIANSSSEMMNVVLSITDNGEGIDQESISRIFTPFFTTKQNGEGTGLGLSIVAKIAQEHQASLSLRSHKNSGTSFQVHFPVIHDDTPVLSPQKNITN
ncbi:MAG: ATP-binding protein [Desulfoplanes sp.]|nr:ATP-binding protein [Desulfoplanes sp.]MDD4648941.1 ATP-binding protein [Desulfoplanes sp.]